MRNRFLNRSIILYCRQSAKYVAEITLLAISSESNENYVGVFDRNLS